MRSGREVLLDVKGIQKSFGAVRAIQDVSVTIRSDEIVGLIGPNGSGKTTLFHCISGFMSPNSGTVEFKGDVVTGMKPEALAHRGLVRTFQHVMVFPELTVLEGVQRAQMCGSRRRREGAESVDIPTDAGDIVELAGLTEFAGANVGSAPYGIQRLANVAMALSAMPELLMLDEPVAGLHPEESAMLAALLEKVRSLGTTVLIIDHNMPFLMPLCDHIFVLDAGKNLFDGKPADVQASEEVAAVYLGHQETKNVSLSALGGDQA